MGRLFWLLIHSKVTKSAVRGQKRVWQETYLLIYTYYFCFSPCHSTIIYNPTSRDRRMTHSNWLLRKLRQVLWTQAGTWCWRHIQWISSISWRWIGKKKSKCFTSIESINEVNNGQWSGPFINMIQSTLIGVHPTIRDILRFRNFPRFRNSDSETPRIQETPGCHDSETPGCPDSETPGCPDSETPGCPDSETPGCPDSETPGCPDSETPGCPDSETPGYPDSETPACPDSETPGRPDSATPLSPDAETLYVSQFRNSTVSRFRNSRLPRFRNSIEFLSRLQIILF